MMFEEGHPIISLSAWKGFCAWEKSLKGFPSRLIDEMVDRNECGCLPDWFVPLAYGVAIASDALLRKAGHRPMVCIVLAAGRSSTAIITTGS